MPEAVVDRIVFNPPAWFKIFLKNGDHPLMVHWNWFTNHGRIYEGKEGYTQDAIKPGDRISFDITKPVYIHDDENIYIQNLQIVREALVEADVL